MSKRYNRPLKYDDFRGHECGKVTIHMINTYWGSLNKMKEDLGLEIVQQNMDKLTHDSFIRDMEYIKLYLEENNKDFITEEEIDSINEIHSYCCLNKYIKNNYNTSFSDYCAINGIQTGKCGRGIEYKFEDGEKTSSQFEYLFSNYLRCNNLIFNKDYFRNVRYRDIDSSYDGLMDCDYEIHYGGNIIYVELAGILRDYKEWYYADRKIIGSKSREKYRIKLKAKESILKRNNLTYFILFPCDLINNYMNDILYNPSSLLRREIEIHNEHNIDWSLIRNAS